MANEEQPNIVVTSSDEESELSTSDIINQDKSKNRLHVPPKSSKRTMTEPEQLERKVRKVTRGDQYTEAQVIASLQKYSVSGDKHEITSEANLRHFVHHLKNKDSLQLFLDKMAKKSKPEPVSPAISEPASKKVKSTKFRAQLESLIDETIMSTSDEDIRLGVAYSARLVLESLKNYNDTGNASLIISDGPIKQHITSNNIQPGGELGESVNEKLAVITSYIEAEEAKMLVELEAMFQAALADNQGSYSPEDIMVQLSQYHLKQRDGEKITPQGGLRELVMDISPHLVQQFVNDKMENNQDIRLAVTINRILEDKHKPYTSQAILYQLKDYLADQTTIQNVTRSHDLRNMLKDGTLSHDTIDNYINHAKAKSATTKSTPPPPINNYQNVIKDYKEKYKEQISDLSESEEEEHHVANTANLKPSR